MNDEPKRLLDEDPDGAASALIRAALGNASPVPAGAKERAAKQLGIDVTNVATVTPLRGRRIAVWSAGATLLAAAAGAIFVVMPQKDAIHEQSSPVAIPAPTSTPAPDTPMEVEPSPAPTAIAPPLAPPAATPKAISPRASATSLPSVSIPRRSAIPKLPPPPK